jgi:hypothetical protein
MRKTVIVLMLAIAYFIAPAIADANYMSGFESLTASTGGTVLTGQDGYYVPEGVDYNVYTYSGNTLGLPQNPGGGSNFVAGIGEGYPNLARAQRDVSFDSGGICTIGYDFAGAFIGQAPPAQYLGSFSLRSGSTDNFYLQLDAWTESGSNWNATYMVYDAAGYFDPVEGRSPGSAWENLDINHWYHSWTTMDFDSNKIIEVGIADLVAGTESIFNPTDWYLLGGAAGGTETPTGFRLFSGGDANYGNVMAFDNISIQQPVPEPATMLLFGSGLIGLAVFRKRLRNR